MEKETHAKTNENPVMLSNSRVIMAADAALAAINKHFEAEVESSKWYDLALLQRAALKTALSSIILTD